MFKVAKNAFLFVGAMIGAGFATGAELMVFFSNGSIWTVILSGVLITIMSLVFCMFGRVGRQSRLFKSLLSTIVYISSIITFVAMIGGANNIMLQGFNIPMVGFISAVVVSLVVMFNMEKIKTFNLIIMPVVIVLVIVLASKSTYSLTTQAVDFPRAISYVGMNLLLAGFLLAESSREMTAKQSVSCCLLIGIIITALIVVMLNLALQGSSGMPIIDFARQVGSSSAATIIVYLAIITTMIGAAKIIHDKTAVCLAPHKPVTLWHKALASLIMIAIAILAANVCFDTVVRKFYPLTGYMGVYVCGMVIYTLLRGRIALKVTNRSLSVVSPSSR